MRDDELEYLADRQDAWEAAVRAEHHLSRREALKLAAAGTIFAAGAGSLLPRNAFAQVTAPAPVAGIVKSQSPDLLISRGTNAEMQWASMKGVGYRTPVDRFFVRNHTRTPLIDPATWRLGLHGDALPAPVSFSLDDLQQLETVEVDATIECAGNGRSYFGTQQGKAAPGTAWTLGAVGLGTWRGVRLGDVLERAGIDPAAVDVMPIGLDAEVTGSDGKSQGHVRRPIPIKKALHDVIVAFEMNGRVLPADHGFPARLIVPGWVGIANTKWLGSIEVSRQPLFSPWNTTQYRLVGQGYPADIAPLTANPLKSAFELPVGAVFAAGRRRTLTGRSWSGRWRRAQPDATRFNRDGYWFDAVVQHGVTVS